jgi:hypothetical protein
MNPVTTARYFDYKMKELFKGTSSPVGSFRDKILLDSYIIPLNTPKSRYVEGITG